MNQQLRNACGVPEPYRTAVVDGVELAYADSGAGPTVVCLHAVGHGGGDFVPLRDRLGDRFRFLLVDWPGQGRSGSDPQPASAARYGQLLEGLLARLQVHDAVILGNSIGGSVALGLAAVRPEMIRALVLANSGGLIRIDAATRFACRMSARFFAAGARGAWWFPRAFDLYYRQVLPGAAARQQRARIVAAAYEIAPVLAQAWSTFGQPDADLRDLAKRIKCPVLCAWARHDRIISLNRSKAAIEAFANARTQLFEGGHSAFLEDPDAFAEALHAFFDDLGRSAVAA
ncbi:MAG TPA: alpha/beta hydrolase [Candidatus Acidoferrales bacterium]|nr:alpha/beta hydrolase [Candidatus Acidoferrales bacterium]